MDRESERQVDRTSLSCSNLAHAFAGAEEDQAAILKTIPQGHFGGSEDIGKLAAFLALECPHVTGQIWSVDGGRSVSGPLSVG